MSSSGDFESAFGAARRLHEQGRHEDAERAYRELLDDAPNRERVLVALTELYLQSARFQQAAETLARLTTEYPDQPRYYWDLASLLLSAGNADGALRHYRRLLERHPDYAAGHYNFGILCKRALRYRDALRAHEKAIELGIDHSEEVFTNLGVLYSDMRDAANAEAMYERALEIDTGYVPASYNLAMLCEETGDRARAEKIYEDVLARDSQQWGCLARLGQIGEPESLDDPLLARIRDGIEQSRNDSQAQEGLQFALGKLLDGLGDYENAYAAYRAANELGRQRNPRYDGEATRQGFEQLVAHFSAEWVRAHATDASAGPIFVCGMFRSGSTLVEQMLGAHPEVTAGGELDILPSIIARRLMPYPQRLASITSAELLELSNEYVAWTRDMFPSAMRLTDKRPDNFLHLGLIKALFPRARIVYTRRNLVDNCLSIYFQQLGGNLSYATDLNDTADYYRHHEALMRHWHTCFGDDIFTVEYDALVQSPERLLRDLLEFLELPWDPRCLEFDRTQGIVKTASLWQVRDGLHTSSSGRWQHYADVIPELEELADASAARHE